MIDIISDPAKLSLFLDEIIADPVRLAMLVVLLLLAVRVLFSFGVSAYNFIMRLIRRNIKQGKDYYKSEIDKIIKPQLESTYTDAPIDGKKWVIKLPFSRFLYKMLSLFGAMRGDYDHDDITIRVYRRLLLRHSLLDAVENMSSIHDVNDDATIKSGILTKSALQSYISHHYAQSNFNNRVNAAEFDRLLSGTKPRKLKVLTQNTTHDVNASIDNDGSGVAEESQPYILLPAKIRAYNLAVTDLFVEKALAYLNRKARTYNRWAKSFIAIALLAIFIGAFVAFVNTVDWNDKSNPMVGIASWADKIVSSTAEYDCTPFFLSLPSFSGNLGDNTAYMPHVSFLKDQTSINNDTNNWEKIRSNIKKMAQGTKQSLSMLSVRNVSTMTENDIDVYRMALEDFVKTNPEANKKEIAASLFSLIGSDRNTQHWIKLISSFVKGFTFYGLLVLLAVFCYRMSRALFDQAERLKDRRHAMRQGRLFVHLNGGKMSVDEMEKAFNWNMSSDNAFANINTDAQAPWGLVVKDMLKTLRETAKAGIKAAERK